MALPTDKEMVDRWRRNKMDGKFAILEQWVRDCEIDVLVMDTVNDFFRGKHENPSDERAVGNFFDRMRDIPAQAFWYVTTARKRSTMAAQILTS
jgi:archaellum biogenesis ATPase FlaH